MTSASMSATVLSAKNIKKRFGDFEAIAGLDLEIRKGECVGLLGPNGAGKSTFIGAVYGVVERTAGELAVFGMDPRTHAREIKKRLGVVPQENCLDEGLTVFENMRVFAAFVGLPAERSGARIKELLDYMALGQKENAPIRFLSGGMKRRLAFVRALLAEPELVILDEPTTGLDPAVRHLLWEKVVQMKGQGKTVLVTTHYMHEAEVLCDRVLIMNKGKIVDNASPRKLIDTHTPGFVALFEEGEGNRTRIKSALPAQWTFFQQREQFCVRAPSLEELIAFQEKIGQALQLRPANLEDVFLKLTGEELAGDA